MTFVVVGGGPTGVEMAGAIAELAQQAIGRSRAVAQFGGVRLSGLAAWVLWSVAHVYFLIGFRNRFVVALNWVWSYLTFQRGSRLITGLYARADEIRQSPRTELRSQAG